ncbi:MAG: rRNA maturation RNase YbeY [Pseudomonadales bacterium]
MIVDFENTTQQATPDAQSFEHWVQTALTESYEQAELSVCIIDEEEMTSLNSRFRGQNKSTNVLSFPADLPEGMAIPLLGDIAICAPVIEREAMEQQKSLESHYAHMAIHGALHLAGYDHIDDSAAEEMEALEIKMMGKLGFANPYEYEREH